VIITVQSQTPGTGPALPAGLDPVDILLIDDDPGVRAMLEKVLRRAGYSVESSKNGKTTLELLARHSFRLVITDIYMPDMDGYQVIMKINGTKPRPLVLAISGGAYSSAASSLKTAQLLGSSRLMAKPFDLAEFCATVRELIGLPAARAISPEHL
jgi:DNA-binding NtrC family response regulator